MTNVILAQQVTAAAIKEITRKSKQYRRLQTCKYRYKWQFI